MVRDRRSARLETSRTDVTEARPGDQITVETVIRPYRGERQVCQIPIRIPTTASKGPLRILVSDGDTLDRVHRAVPMMTRGMGLGPTIALLNTERSDDRVYVSLFDSGGSISGYEDEWTAGGLAKRAFSGGSYSPIAGSNPNSNNAGTLALNTGAFPSSYQVVLDAAGDIQMIAASGGESGSGIAEPAATNKFNKGAGNPATFAFGFAGVDASNNRVGYAGLLPTDGVSKVTGGLIDANDNGNATNGICSVSAAPCAVTGSYSPDGTVTNLWHLTLTAPIAMTFDFFVANGNESSPNNPLYLYAISTDNNPAVVGTMVLQNSKITSYDNGALTGGAISAVTGADGNVAIVLGDLDGSGDFTGTFAENNNGAVVLLPPIDPCPNTAMPDEVCGFANTYAATNNNTGRYTLKMLGNPNASTAVKPLDFVLYASGAGRGFLLDQSSTAVFTGTMSSQVPPKQNLGKGRSAATKQPHRYCSQRTCP